MIYTVTFNPAIDYIVRMDKPLDPGMTNRSASEECYFGGKGINVSTVLKNLGIENTALGFAAGFTGEAIVKSVNEKGIIADFIMSRSNPTRRPRSMVKALRSATKHMMNFCRSWISWKRETSSYLREASLKHFRAMSTRSSLKDFTARASCS